MGKGRGNRGEKPEPGRRKGEKEEEKNLPAYHLIIIEENECANRHSICSRTATAL